ncbi:MAG: amidohydrolase [Clostridium sp.]|nr:amidohydrolase [Clostridium sp.]
MITFLNEANTIKDELIEIRRDIHKHPELGFQEERTSTLIKKFLYKEGIKFKSVAKTGVCAEIKGELKRDSNKVIALRADIDALPIQDKKDVPYASKVKGKMHACGHDAHTTILLGAAKILNKHKEQFSGTVKFLFEPAEETIGGAPQMIEEGVLENPKVDMVVGLHVSEDVEVGKIKVRKAWVNASSNPFSVKIVGNGGHGATPQVTVDPIVASAFLITELQTIVSREIPPVRPVVITIGSIHGGSASNVIPDEVEIKGIIRTISEEDRKYVLRRFKDIINNVCKSFRTKAYIKIEEGYPSLFNNSDVVDRVIHSAQNILGRENILRQVDPSMGVESFAYFAEERPSAFYYLGTGNKQKNTDKPAHSSLFDIDEDAICLGVSLQCSICYEYLTSD